MLPETADAAATRDADRLLKLWDAYRLQEEELREALARLERLTREMEGKGMEVAQREAMLAAKDHEIARLQDQLGQKERRIAELLHLEESVKAVEAFKDRITQLESALAHEKERLAKLFLLYEEATKARQG